jgi:hypothetical protein
LDEVLQLADEQYQQGRASGDAVDYGLFEERVARATAKVEQDVHRIALSGLDVDVPFIRVWGKHYRRVHRRWKSLCRSTQLTAAASVTKPSSGPSPKLLAVGTPRICGPWRG